MYIYIYFFKSIFITIHFKQKTSEEEIVVSMVNCFFPASPFDMATQ